jgi:hypothetical protein
MKFIFLALIPCLWLWPTFECVNVIASVPNLIGLDSLLYNVNQVSNSRQAINKLLSSVYICEIIGDARFWLRVWLAYLCGSLVEIYSFLGSRESSCHIGFIASCHLLRRNTRRSRLHVKTTYASQKWLVTVLLILKLRIWREGVSSGNWGPAFWLIISGWIFEFEIKLTYWWACLNASCPISGRPGSEGRADVTK